MVYWVQDTNGTNFGGRQRSEVGVRYTSLKKACEFAIEMRLLGFSPLLHIGYLNLSGISNLESKTFEQLYNECKQILKQQNLKQP